jgi:hypothetical protein
MIDRFEPPALKISRFQTLMSAKWDGVEDLFSLGTRITKGVEEVHGDKPKDGRDEAAVFHFLTAVKGHRGLAEVLGARKDLKQLREVYAAVATYNTMARDPVPLHAEDGTPRPAVLRDKKGTVHELDVEGEQQPEPEGEMYCVEEGEGDPEQEWDHEAEEVYFVRVPRQNFNRGNRNSQRCSGRGFQRRGTGGTQNFRGAASAPNRNKCTWCGGLPHVREECPRYLRWQRNRLGLCMNCGDKHYTSTCTKPFSTTGPPPETATAAPHTTRSTGNTGTGGLNAMYAEVRLPAEPPGAEDLNVVRELRAGATTCTTGSGTVFLVPVEVQGRLAWAIADSGAGLNVISQRFLDSLPTKPQ